eukprot:scaffold11980_cov19-Tisochrysis_lutea.AAC.1
MPRLDPLIPTHTHSGRTCAGSMDNPYPLIPTKGAHALGAWTMHTHSYPLRAHMRWEHGQCIPTQGAGSMDNAYPPWASPAHSGALCNVLYVWVPNAPQMPGARSGRTSGSGSSKLTGKDQAPVWRQRLEAGAQSASRSRPGEDVASVSEHKDRFTCLLSPNKDPMRVLLRIPEKVPTLLPLYISFCVPFEVITLCLLLLTESTALQDGSFSIQQSPSHSPAPPSAASLLGLAPHADPSLHPPSGRHLNGCPTPASPGEPQSPLALRHAAALPMKKK